MSYSPTNASTTTGLYVPVHKRTGSSASSRSSSLTRSEASVSSQYDNSLVNTPNTEHSLVYSRDALLGLMHSPLSRLPLDTRKSLRTAFPELATNRRQRKALEYHTHTYSRTQAQGQARAPIAATPLPPIPMPPQTTSLGQPNYIQSRKHLFVRIQSRRNRPVGCGQERRRHATKIIDEASWRGRRVTAVPIVV